MTALMLGQGTGPLKGIRVIELAGIGPGPHAAMHLADLGADVIRIERPEPGLAIGDRDKDVLTRGRPSVAMNLKDPRAVQTVLDLVETADVLLEGMRPGVTERLGLGPDDCHARNPRLVYGRMTGWGQSGPLASSAGHDVNYIAITGALYGVGRAGGPPQIPLNLLGDFAGGSLYLVVGILAALIEARTSGEGQVVDAAIVDGSAHLNSMLAGMIAGGGWKEERGQNLLDSGAPFYDVYETADGRHMSVGALEPQFYAELLRLLDLTDSAPDRYDIAQFDALRELFAARFKEKTQRQWTEIFDGTDACVAPVLSLAEAAMHPHLAERGTYVDHAGVTQPSPAPRFSRTEATLSSPPSLPGQHSREALMAWGVHDVDQLVETGAVIQS